MSHDFARSHRLKKESSARKPARKKSGGVPSWLWVLVGTLAGCLIMFLVYLSGAAPQLAAPGTSPPAASTGTPAGPASDEPPAPPKRVSPVFEFYTKLPEGGQPVTDVPPAADPASSAPPVAGPVPPVDGSQPAVAPLPAQAAATADADPIAQLLAQKEAEAVAKAETAKPAPEKTEAAKPVARSRYLQAGAFRNKAEAEKLRAKLSLLGLTSSVQSTTNAKGETLQKVLVGPFSSAADADDAKIILSGNGINAIPAK